MEHLDGEIELLTLWQTLDHTRRHQILEIARELARWRDRYG